MNDILLSDKNDIQFNQSGDVASAKDIVGNSNAVNESVKQWIKNRILLDYLNGHPEIQVTRDDKTLTLFVNVNYVISGYATIENIQAMWRL